MDKLTFAGFPFPYNPESYEATQEKHTAVRIFPGGGAQVQIVAIKPRKISGEGAFVGAYAKNFRRNMTELFERKQSALLKLPHGDQMNAFFIQWKIVGDGRAGLLRYQFVFLEDTGGESEVIP